MTWRHRAGSLLLPGRGRTPQADLLQWIEGQARRERDAVRLEDALLADRYVAYFAFRLRFFLARTAAAALLHAIRIALLFGAFPRDQVLVLVALGAGAAVISDAWWGALERMRGRIRRLQRDGSGYRIPKEIASWLRLSSWLTAGGLAVAGLWAGAMLVSGSAPGPASVYSLVIVTGAAVGLTTRTFHSGAYALRRVYRPLRSLVVVDAAGMVVLLAGWPLLGTWAFPLAEAVAVAATIAITLRYTSRTYRVLGFPTLLALLRTPAMRPRANVLRSAILPALAYGSVGIESLVVIAVVASPSQPASAQPASALLLGLFAALSPVIRAGFEWVRLLYFDLVRLEVPLLRGMRRRFDAAVLRLAVAMGAATWVIAAAIGVAALGIRDPVLMGVLLPFMVTRSLLAAAQLRTFTGGAYGRLWVIGAAGLVGVALVLVAHADEAVRLAGVSALLLASFVALLVRPSSVDPDDQVLALPDWLARLRAEPGEVVVAHARFDARTLARGVTREERRTETWRRAQVGRRIAGQVARSGGGAAWLGPLELVWFQRHDRRAAGIANGTPWFPKAAGGLVARQPSLRTFQTGAAAALHVAQPEPTGRGSDIQGGPAQVGPAAPPSLEVEFLRRFPGGIVYHADRPAPPQLVAIPSRERAQIMRAALRFARDLVPPAEPHGRDVSALLEDGRIRTIFVIDRIERAAARRQWAGLVRDWDLMTAAHGSPAPDDRATAYHPRHPRGPGRTRRLSRP